MFNNVWLPECETRSCNTLKEKDLSDTDLAHTKKLKEAEPLGSKYPLSNVQLRECGIIFSLDEDLNEEEEEEGENDPGDIIPDELAFIHGIEEEVQDFDFGALVFVPQPKKAVAEEFILGLGSKGKENEGFKKQKVPPRAGTSSSTQSDAPHQPGAKATLVENNFRREVEKKVEDLGKMVDWLERSKAELTLRVQQLEADKKNAMDLSVYEHKFAREIATDEAIHREVEARKKATYAVSSSQRVVCPSPSASGSLGWYARLPSLQEPTNYGTIFETGIYEEQVKSGYRLPLHPFALRFFEHYRMAPGQLVPNGWRKLAGLIYLVQTSGYKPDATDFMRVFFEICFVKGVANCPGWYYIHSRQRLLKGGPKSNKGWHSRYFFVGRLDKGELPFDRDWNPFCKDFENPGKPTPNNLTKHILSHIKLRGGLCIDEPLSEEQLEWAKIIPPKPIPTGLQIPSPLLAIPSMSSAETIPRWLAEVENHPKEVFLAFFRKLRGSARRNSPMYASGSEMLSRFEMARQVAADEAQQKREAVKEAQEASHRAEELSKQEADHLAQIATLEKRLERVKRKAAEEVTKARDQGIRDFLDGNAGDEWLKKQIDDGLEIYELGFAKAKEMFVERFPDISLDDFVLPAVISPSGETAMPSKAGDAAASHPPGESPSGDAPEP
ncbi:hypothetical protein RJ639_010692 [Escallonia herrerae]|uniref:Transposase (putative) gypsy type domain-containing protein n=1 Tax=Escallonia herrerae TaxID=1293975 RepID=A0AA88VKP3_9ASTE|nr:hypothetical protein RJ639_010692 [Escallonia herrerae]